MITAWIVVTVVSKSATSWLIETFITDWSRTMMNCAPARATSGSHFFIGLSVPAFGQSSRPTCGVHEERLGDSRRLGRNLFEAVGVIREPHHL